jgi:uroporphyrin-3 C-methyltransferase
MKEPEALRPVDIPVLQPPAPVRPARNPLAFLLALLALAASGWLWWQAEQLAVTVDRLAQSIPAPTPPGVDPQAFDALRDANTGLVTRISALEEYRAADAQAAKSLRESVESIAAAAREKDRALTEAEYLQRLAAQSLLMGHEVRGALGLLEASDAILRERDDPALHLARERLAEDIAALRAVAGFDREGLYLRLAALGASIPGLSTAERRVVPDSPAPAAEQAAGESGSGIGERVLALLAPYVQVRRDAETVAPLLPLAEEQLVRLSIRLAIEQAKLALLAAESKAYIGALAEAGGLVRAHFGDGPGANKAFLQEVARLSGERVAPELPDLADSLRALREASAMAGGR